MPSRDSQLPRVAKNIQPSGRESEKNVQEKTLGMPRRRAKVADVIELTACYNPPQQPTAFDRFIDSLPDA